MTISDYIHVLEDVRAEYGDLDVLTKNLPFTESDTPTISSDITHWVASLQ